MSLPDSAPRLSSSGLIGLVAVVAVFYLTTLRDGHAASDFFVLVQHTLNLVEGRAYTAPRLVPHPGGVLPPMSAQPGFPALLAPVVLLFGLNLTVLKALMALSFAVALLAFGLLARRDLSAPFAALAVVGAGLLPVFWAMKDTVGPGLPFLALACLCLLAADRLARPAPPRLRWGLYAALGVGLYAALELRSVGVVLPASLLAYDVLRRRLWPSAFSLVPVAIAGTGLILRRLLFPIETNSDYLTAFILRGDLSTFLVGMAERAYRYLHGSTVNLLFENGYVPGLRYLVGGLVLGLALVGFVWHVRRRFSIVDVFVVLYLAAVVVYPFQLARYLVPVHLFLFFYCAAGLEQVHARVGRGRPVVVAAALGLVLLSTYAANYTTRPFRQVPNDLLSPACREAYAFVARETPADAVVVHREPHVLALYGERTSRMPRPPGFWVEGDIRRLGSEEAAARFAHFEQVGASYALLGPLEAGRPAADARALWHLVRDYEERFERVFDNGTMELYRILPE